MPEDHVTFSITGKYLASRKYSNIIASFRGHDHTGNYANIDLYPF